MILAILAFYFGFKKGRDSGRSGVLWAFVCGLTFIGAQIVVAIGFGAFIGIGVELWGWNETLYDDLSWVITLVSIAASVVPLLLIFRYLDRIPDDPLPTAPPPPPTFDQNDK